MIGYNRLKKSLSRKRPHEADDGNSTKRLKFFGRVSFTGSGLSAKKKPAVEENPAPSFRGVITEAARMAITGKRRNDLNQKLNEKPQVGKIIRQHYPPTQTVPTAKQRKHKSAFQGLINTFSKVNKKRDTFLRKFQQKNVDAHAEWTGQKIGGEKTERANKNLAYAQSLLPELPEHVDLTAGDDAGGSEEKQLTIERVNTVDTLKTATSQELDIFSQTTDAGDSAHELPYDNEQQSRLDKSHITLSDDDEDSRDYETPETGSEHSSSLHQEQRVPPKITPPKRADRTVQAEAAFKQIQGDNRDLDKISKGFEKIVKIDAKDRRCKLQIDLTDYEIEEADEIINARSSQRITMKFKLEMYGHTMRTLGHLQWLDDNVINFYMEMINERSRAPGSKQPKVWAVSTFFFASLCDKGYPGVRRWSKRQKVDVFSLKYLIVPVHLGVHWTISVIDFEVRTITFYDSMGSPSNGYNEILHDYLQQEHKHYKGTELPDPDGWQLISARRDSPQQNNGSDCGVFSCCIAENASRNGGFGGWNFDQSMMPNIRRKMALEIKNGELY